MALAQAYKLGVATSVFSIMSKGAKHACTHNAPIWRSFTELAYRKSKRDLGLSLSGAIFQFFYSCTYY